MTVNDDAEVTRPSEPLIHQSRQARQIESFHTERYVRRVDELIRASEARMAESIGKSVIWERIFGERLSGVEDCQ